MPAFAVIPADKEHDTIVAFKASVVGVLTGYYGRLSSWAFALVSVNKSE